MNTLWHRYRRLFLSAAVVLGVGVLGVGAVNLWNRQNPQSAISLGPLTGLIGGGPSAQTVKIAVVTSLTGSGEPYGSPSRDGALLAIEEANATGAGRRIEYTVYDDGSDNERGRAIAREIAAGDALVVVGPATTAMSLAAGPVYSDTGVVSVGTIATSDGITANATTFRASFSTSDGGEAMAHYLRFALNGRRAAVLFRDDGYGQPVSVGFRRAAERIGITATYYPFTTAAEADAAVRKAAADAAKPAIILGMVVADAAPLMITLKQLGVQAPIIGTNTIAGDFFKPFFGDLPEEIQTPGYFTDGIYAVSSQIFDSANAEALAFADRFRTRFGREPSYIAVHGYESARLAIAAAHAATATAGANADLPTRRSAVRSYLTALNSPKNSVAGLNGPLWFTPERGREQPLRVGRFYRTTFESAPLQIVPVTTPDKADLDSGAVFAVAPDRYARLQRVVYTGVFVNEIPRVDLTRSSFSADFYLWLRFAREAGPGSADPTELGFPNLLSGGFDRARPSEQRVMADGLEYRLWRVQGEFRNDFDLRRYPFDQQTLALSFFNSRAPMERIVYVLDQRVALGERPALTEAANADDAGVAQAASSTTAAGTATVVSGTAFRNLTQWTLIGAHARRENLVTPSTLGDPARIGDGGFRELSGFLVTVDLQRQTISTLIKTVLPLLVMALIMFSVLYFPPSLVKEKVTVAVTATLAGVVLLTSINSQIGSVGYTVAVEYVFYVFFGLALLCMVSVLSAERLRSNGQGMTALATEYWTRIIFVLAMAATVIGALVLYLNR